MSIDLSRLSAGIINLLRRIQSGEYAEDALFDSLTLDLLGWRALPCPPMGRTGRDQHRLSFCQKYELVTPECELTDLGLVALEMAPGGSGEQPAEQTPEPEPAREVKSMPSVARESVESGEGEKLPGPQPYPVHIASVSEEVAHVLKEKPKNDDPPLPTIWYHGERSYSVDGHTPVTTTREQHNILKAFLDKNVALDTQELSKTGVSNVTDVIEKIVKKFGEDTVRRPKNKGDGYFVRVRTRKLTN
jgi:hypothetical protein